MSSAGFLAGSCSKHRLTVPWCVADAFADAAEQEEDTSGVDYVHIRIQQRNGKKSLTTVQVMPAWDRFLLFSSCRSCPC
jgi:translation initiation factor 1 (eIF-1/SUI1)